MKEWVVIKREDFCGLYVRDYPCQGVNPDFELFKIIDEDTAQMLVTNKLAIDLYGDFES